MGTYKYNGIISIFDNAVSSLKVGTLHYGDNNDQVMRIIDNMQGGWGDIYPMVIVSNSSFPLPKKMTLRWVTLVDLKCYELTTDLDTERMESMWAEQEKLYPENPFKYVVVGIAPYGEVALWLRSNCNSVLFQQFKAEEVAYNEREEAVYSKMQGNEKLMKYILTPERYASVMQQYKYRYVPLEEFFNGKRWARFDTNDNRYENISVSCVEDKCIDGTFDFTDGENIMKYHTAGMPKRITVKWEEDGDPYFAHFWLNSHYVQLFFESFKKKFPELPVDLKLRLDVKANRYEVAMAAEDIVPRAFIGTQYIVFKYFEEIARSEYFDKEDNDWRWE